MGSNSKLSGSFAAVLLPPLPTPPVGAELMAGSASTAEQPSPALKSRTAPRDCSRLMGE